MNSKLLFKTLGLSALTVGLVALPGSSARKQESTGTEGQEVFPGGDSAGSGVTDGGIGETGQFEHRFRRRR